MPWNEPGGDGGNNQQDPWTGKNRGSGRNDAEEIINKLNEKLGGLFGGGKNNGDGDGSSLSLKGLGIIGVLLLAGWMFSGFYTVDEPEEALVLRLGAYSETNGPGLHWHWPYPIEAVEIINVDQNRSASDSSNMLTIDENIVDISVTVQYKVSNSKDYAFNVFLPDNLNDQRNGTLYQVMRSATRDIVGRSSMDFIIGESREQIAEQAKVLMQEILDGYTAGLQILKVNLTDAKAPAEVKDAFDDANRAREDANRFKNEADTYAKRVIPEARGQAARMLEEANAYREQVIAKAEGDASRFSQLVKEYRRAPDVTRERLYLETMETVLSGTRKVLVDSQNSNNLLYMPLGNTGTNSNDMPSPAQVASPFVNSTGNNQASSNGRQSRNLQPGLSRGGRQ